MLILFFTFVVYVFFIYGVIEFFRRVYIDFTKSNKSYNPPAIKVLIDNQKDIEYTIRSLQRNYTKITVLLNEGIEIPKTTDNISKNMEVEFKYLSEEKRLEGLD